VHEKYRSVVHLESVEAGNVRLSQRVWQCDRPKHPSVVLLPATGETAADWDAVAAELSRDRVVRSVDLRGHGDSDWPGDYSLELMAADIVALLRRSCEQSDLVGHSLGGLVACLAAAAAPPDSVRRLALEDVPMPHPRPAAIPPRPAGRLDFDWRVIEQVRPEIDNPHSAWPDVVRRINVPTLVIAGGSRSTIPQQHVIELAEVLTNGRLVTIDAGHLVHAIQPKAFLEHLIAFLAD
jgi:pimeloyl-ACP methyl ester carboxylesterase